MNDELEKIEHEVESENLSEELVEESQNEQNYLTHEQLEYYARDKIPLAPNGPWLTPEDIKRLRPDISENEIRKMLQEISDETLQPGTIGVAGVPMTDEEIEASETNEDRQRMFDVFGESWRK